MRINKHLSVSFLLAILSLPFILNAQNDVDNVVIGKHVKLFSKVLNEERTLLISLPEGYDNSKQTYPVLYVLDGEKGTLVEAVASANPYANSYCPEMIIVAIKITRRNRDVLPGTDTSPRFLKFITEELFTYIKKEYRADDNQRILYGASNAGVFVLFSFLDNPDNFSGYIASSPTICWRKEFMINKTKELLAKNININKFFYIIYGDKDFKVVVDTLEVYLPLFKKLKQKGLRLQTKYIPEEGHVPVGSLQLGLLAMYEGYIYPDEKRKTEGLDSLKAYYARYSNKVGYVVNPPLNVLTRLGQWFLLEKKNYKESCNVLEYALQLYPDDFVCTVILAMAYWGDNSLDQAKKYYLKTLEIMKKTNEQEPPFDEWKAMKKKFE